MVDSQGLPPPASPGPQPWPLLFPHILRRISCKDLGQCMEKIRKVCSIFIIFNIFDHILVCFDSRNSTTEGAANQTIISNAFKTPEGSADLVGMLKTFRETLSKYVWGKSYCYLTTSSTYRHLQLSFKQALNVETGPRLGDMFGKYN